MQYFPEFLTIAFIHLLAVMSPGPDFAMITRNSLVYSRKVGIYSAIGLGLGIAVHVTYSLIGIGFIISKSVLLFSILKYMGAAYLIYIGYKSLRARPTNLSDGVMKQKKEIGEWAAIRTGFITNITNPKATLFFFSLFTQVINSSTPVFIQVLYGLEMSVVTFLWFALVAIILSQGIIREKFQAFGYRLEQAMGAVLVALGIKVALSSSK